MQTLTHDELKALTDWEQGASISIYLPRHQAVSELGKDAIVLRNMLDEAETRLQNQGFGTAESRKFLEQARNIQNDDSFWELGSAQGLCLLLAPGAFHQFDLPYQCPQMLTVDDAFYISPLFYKVYEDDRFDVLAISPKAVRMIRHENGSVSEIDLPENMPASLEEYSQGIELEESIQHHSASSGRAGREVAGIIHGHGVAKEQTEKLLGDYYEFLARQLENSQGSGSLPLILACAEKQQSLFRKHFHMNHLLQEGIATSPDQLSAQELIELARPVIKSHAENSLHKAQEQFKNHLGTSRISHQLEEILQSADQGRVEMLFVPIGSERWGQLPQDGELIETHDSKSPGDTALHNRAIRDTYRHGGTPYVINAEDMPDDQPLLAYFRW